MKKKLILVQTANGVKLEAPPPAPTFTKEETEAIQGAASATWSYIGYDMLEANEGKALPRSHVIEVVLDANYMDAHLKDKELLARFYRLAYADRIKMVKPAFPFARYGY